ncbi:MAG: HipA domain-containing protein [Opitutales bacterium]
MQRREAILAKEEGRKSNRLSESDYLLGVYDEVRMGALRFKLEGDKKFLNADKALAAPPFASLRELQDACLHIEDDEENESIKWLNMLLAPGSSLGGARPKANVVDTEGNLWIAKFPSKNDDADVEAWEMVANDLATCLGLNVPEVQLKKFGRAKHTFLTKRFDRQGERRVHFASAMTLGALLKLVFEQISKGQLFFFVYSCLNFLVFTSDNCIIILKKQKNYAKNISKNN